MKRLGMVLGFLTLGSSLFAAGNSNPLIVSSGSFKGIDLYDNSSGGARQAIVIGDATSSTTLTVDSVKGIPVYLSTGTNQVGSFIMIQATVLGATVTFNGAQPITGTVTSLSAVTTSYVVNPTTSPIQIQNAAGSLVGVGYQSGGSSVPVNVLNTVTVTGSLNANSVNITTASWDTTIPAQGSIIGGLGPTGLMQSFRVDASSNVQANIQTLYQPTVLGATVTYNGTQQVNVGVLYQPTVIGATVTFNGAQAVTQSGVWTVQPGNTPNTTDWRVTMATNNVVVMQPTVLGATVTFNGAQPVNNNGTIGFTVTPGTGTWNTLSAVTTSYVVNPTTSPVLSAAINPVGGTITSATSIVSSTFTTAAYTTAGFTIWPGTSTGITVAFDISPDSGTTWINVHAYQNIPDPANGKVAYQSYALTTATTTFRTSITGMTNFRVRATAWTTGIASVTITASSIGEPGIQTVNLGQLAGWVPLNGGSNGSLGVGGITALGSAPNSLPVHVGGLATVGSTLPTKRSNGTITDRWLTGMGAAVSALDCSRDNIVKSSTTLTTTTTETVILSSGAASIFNDLLSILAVNTSATATRVDFRSGGGPSGGTIDFALYLPAGDTRGMATPHIWPQTTAATNWTAQSSASVTDVRIYGIYCKSQ